MVNTTFTKQKTKTGEFEEQGEDPSELAKQEVISGRKVGARQQGRSHEGLSADQSA